MSDGVLSALDGAVEGIMAKGPAAVLFSGGLDSGLIAALARDHGTPRLYTVGLEGSHDMAMSEEAARYLGLPWTPLVMTSDDVIEACRGLLGAVRITSPIIMSFELPLYIIASRAKEDVLISGQGADELFGGYSKYLEMDSEVAGRAMADDLAKMFNEVLPLEDAIARRYGKRVERPFLDPQVRKVAASIPVSEKIVSGERKVPLRSAARSMGFELIATREKKAAQYGSGFMKVLKTRARGQKLTVEEYLASLSSGAT